MAFSSRQPLSTERQSPPDFHRRILEGIAHDIRTGLPRIKRLHVYVQREKRQMVVQHHWTDRVMRSVPYLPVPYLPVQIKVCHKSKVCLIITYEHPLITLISTGLNPWSQTTGTEETTKYEIGDPECLTRLMDHVTTILQPPAS